MVLEAKIWTLDVLISAGLSGFLAFLRDRARKYMHVYAQNTLIHFVHIYIF